MSLSRDLDAKIEEIEATLLSQHLLDEAETAAYEVLGESILDTNLKGTTAKVYGLLAAISLARNDNTYARRLADAACIKAPEASKSASETLMTLDMVELSMSTPFTRANTRKTGKKRPAEPSHTDKDEPSSKHFKSNPV